MRIENVVFALWRKMCAWEGVDPDDLLIVFSRSNPYVDGYDLTMAMALEAMNAG